MEEGRPPAWIQGVVVFVTPIVLEMKDSHRHLVELRSAAPDHGEFLHASSFPTLADGVPGSSSAGICLQIHGLGGEVVDLVLASRSSCYRRSAVPLQKICHEICSVCHRNITTRPIARKRVCDLDLCMLFTFLEDWHQRFFSTFRVPSSVTGSFIFSLFYISPPPL